MKIFVRVAAVLVPVCLSACDRPAIEPSESLVDAKALPPARELARETVQINRGNGGDGFGSHLLSYELRPDNTLAITHYERGRRKGEVIRSSEKFTLPGEIAEQARRKLWRVRPSPLEGVENEARPSGCTRQGPHGFGTYAVVFIREGGEAGAHDDLQGVMDVPDPESCDNVSAQSTRLLVQQVLQSFPESKVASSFRLLERHED